MIENHCHKTFFVKYILTLKCKLTSNKILQVFKIKNSTQSKLYHTKNVIIPFLLPFLKVKKKFYYRSYVYFLKNNIEN